MKAPSAAAGAPRSILILKPSSFGDIIHTLPAVARLRSHWPDAKISWLAHPAWAPLLRGGGLVDEVVIFPREDFRGWRGALKFHRWLHAEIRGRRPDLALDFQGLFRTAIIGRAAGARKLAGLSDAREGARWFYHETVPVPSGALHAVSRNLALSDRVIAGAGQESDAPATGSPRFPLPAGDPLVEAGLIDGEFILLHPFARGAEKSLDIAQVRTICARLSPRRVVLVGQSSGGLPDLPSNVLNLLNRTSILQLIGLTRRAAFVISVDSGPAHLAAALRRPLVAVHTWSDPRRVGPYDPDAWVAVRGQLLRVRDLPGEDESFLLGVSSGLTAAQLEAVCELATSPSNSCA